MERREALKKMSLAMGGALSATTMTAVLSHCSSKNESQTLEGEAINFLDPENLNVVSRIAESIIPKTDTPGAVEAEVPQWINLMLKDCYDHFNQNKFKEGLKLHLEKFSEIHSESYNEIKDDKLEEFLTSYEKDVLTNSNREAEAFFIQTVKELTLLGYFTSEAGATQALKYIPVPARYDPCIEMEDTKAWATS